MIDFSNVKNIVIPEGTVKKIVNKASGEVLWEKEIKEWVYNYSEGVLLENVSIIPIFLVQQTFYPTYLTINSESNDGLIGRSPNTNGYAGSLFSSKMYDLSNKKKICIDGKFDWDSENASGYFIIGISNNKTSGFNGEEALCHIINGWDSERRHVDGIIELDVNSIDGLRYIYVTATAAKNTPVNFTIRSIWLE